MEKPFDALLYNNGVSYEDTKDAREFVLEVRVIVNTEECVIRCFISDAKMARLIVVSSIDYGVTTDATIVLVK